MRAGRLRHLATVAEVAAAGADASRRDITQLFVGINQREGDVASAPTGLRNPAKAAVIARASGALFPGRYIVCGARLFIINNVRDPDGKGNVAVMGCDELCGEPATFTPSGGTPRAVRVFLRFDAPHASEFATRPEYRTQVEIAVIECGRPQAGDVFTVRGQIWRVEGTVSDTDDAVVRALWVRPT